MGKDYLDCYANDTIVCPYCYTKFEWDDCIDYLREESYDAECPFCNKEFIVNTYFKTEFTTMRIKNGEPQEVWWDDEGE